MASHCGRASHDDVTSFRVCLSTRMPGTGGSSVLCLALEPSYLFRDSDSQEVAKEEVGHGTGHSGECGLHK
jgi:hypothetical protein